MDAQIYDSGLKVPKLKKWVVVFKDANNEYRLLIYQLVVHWCINNEKYVFY